MRQIIVIANDMRSTFNVGSLLRTAEGLGVSKVYFTGYTPHPKYQGDTRLPHIAEKLDIQIHKTALGAEHTINWEYKEDVSAVLDRLEAEGYQLLILEQSETAVELQTFSPPDKVVLLLGNEIAGVPDLLLQRVKNHLVIPMYGSKESFNVVQAAAMALYHLRFSS